MLLHFSNIWWTIFFCDYLDNFVVIHLDDILIYSTNQEKHEHHVYLILETFQGCGLDDKLEKCLFHQTYVEFLGYIISKKGISMDMKKIQSILEWLLQHLFEMCKIFLLFHTSTVYLSKIILRLLHLLPIWLGKKNLYGMKMPKAFFKLWSMPFILIHSDLKTIICRSRCI